MNQCPPLIELEDLLEARLEPRRQSELARHLDGCSLCQAALDRLTTEAETLPLRASLGSTDVPPDAALQRVMSRLRATPPALLIDRSGIRQNSEVGSIGRENVEYKPAVAVGSGLNEREASEIRFPGPPTPDAPLGTLGPYQVLAQVAEGATGLMFRAVDSRLGRIVALKVLRGELAATQTARARLVREARVVASLQHEHIVTLFEIGAEPDFPPYLVLEFVAGESLADRTTREKSLPPREAARLIGQAALALEAAHAKGLVHRDIKPSNILRERATGNVKLVDFGLARLAEPDTKVTQAGTIAGTPAYMSPEQISRPDEIDARSDVYSLGVVLYELLTGEVPFRGVVRMTLLQVLHDDPRPLTRLNDAVPRDLETICLKAMAKEPARRYATARQFAEDLARWTEGRPVLARPLSRPARLWRWSRRNPAVASLTSAVLLLLVCVALGSTVSAWWLKSARDTARSAQSDARRSAAAATEQLDVLFGALRKLVFDVQEQLDEDEVDLDEVQEMLLDTAVDGLRKVARSADNAGLTDRSTVAAHVRLGATLLRLDKTGEAEQQFQQAERMLQTLLQESPADLELARLQLDIDWSRSENSFFTDDGRTAIREASRAVERCRQLVERLPENSEARRLLAKALFELAEVAILALADLDGEDLGPENHQPIRLYDESIRLYTALVADNPVEQSLASELVQARSGLGHAYSLLDDARSARKHWRQAAELAAKFGDQFPGEPKFRYHLYLAYDGLAEADRDEGRLREAEATYLKAIDMSRGLIRTLPDHLGFDEDLAQTCESLAELYESQDKLPEALKYLRQRHQILRRLSRRDTSDDTLPTELARACVDLARVNLAQRDQDGAHGFARQALEILEPRIAGDVEALEDREQLLLAHTHLAELAGLAKDSSEERRQWKLAQEQVERLRKIDRSDELLYLEDSLEDLAAEIRNRLERLSGLENVR